MTTVIRQTTTLTPTDAFLKVILAIVLIPAIHATEILAIAKSAMKKPTPVTIVVETRIALTSIHVLTILVMALPVFAPSHRRMQTAMTACSALTLTFAIRMIQVPVLMAVLISVILVCRSSATRTPTCVTTASPTTSAMTAWIVRMIPVPVVLGSVTSLRMIRTAMPAKFAVPCWVVSNVS
jgi:hypothetical protein